ncbi:MAG TPA: SurA N-terminal domain-containing protein [Holophagaceae bacterium]|nr:SurA N-terminal domain-containing protein [Holophagaceae bacterium]
MTKITTLALAAGTLALPLALGCGSRSADTSRVLANVGGEKITEAEFREAVAQIMPKEQVEDFLTKQDPAAKAQRIQVLGGLAQMRAMMQFAKTQGLDQDPKVRLQLQSAQAGVYANALLERSTGEPTEAQLKAKYDEFAAASKAQGQDKGFPSFEDVAKNPQMRSALAQQWRKGQMEAAQKGLQAQLKTAVPMTFAEGYQPVE